MKLRDYLKGKYPDIDLSEIAFFDTETTGFEFEKGHRMVEFGAVVQSEDGADESLQLYFNPDRESDADALKVHGLTTERLEEEPEFYLKAKEILSFLKGRVVIAHNIGFDESFIDGELGIASRRLDENLGRLKDYCTLIDSVELAKKIFPAHRVSLDSLCNKYGIDKSSRKFHGALLDSQLLKEVFVRMLDDELNDVFDENRKPYSEEITVTPLKLARRPRVVDLDCGM